MKEKKPGDHIILRLKNNESPIILDWINCQSNLSDAIRYLIEEEIKSHDLRNLQESIPAKRKPVSVESKQIAASVEQDVEPESRSEPEPEAPPDSEESEQEEEEYSEDVIDAWMNM